MNLSDTKPFWCWTQLILNLIDTEPIWYWSLLILNPSNTEPIRHQTYQILNLPDAKPFWYWTNQIRNNVPCPLKKFLRWQPFLPCRPCGKMTTKQFHPVSSPSPGLRWTPTPPNRPCGKVNNKTGPLLSHWLRLDRSTALYIYKAKNCKLLVQFTDAQKTKFIFK
jgi:hypothetical protein